MWKRDDNNRNDFGQGRRTNGGFNNGGPKRPFNGERKPFFGGGSNERQGGFRRFDNNTQRPPRTREIKPLLINIRLVNGGVLPKYETDGSNGMDITANTTIVIAPGQIVTTNIGVVLNLPNRLEAQVRARSSLGQKGLFILSQSVSTENNDKEVEIILTNFGKETITIEQGQRYAQFVFTYIQKVGLEITDNLSNSTRNEGGFGSTGA